MMTWPYVEKDGWIDWGLFYLTISCVILTCPILMVGAVLFIFPTFLEKIVYLAIGILLLCVYLASVYGMISYWAFHIKIIETTEKQLDMFKDLIKSKYKIKQEGYSIKLGTKYDECFRIDDVGSNKSIHIFLKKQISPEEPILIIQLLMGPCRHDNNDLVHEIKSISEGMKIR